MFLLVFSFFSPFFSFSFLSLFFSACLFSLIAVRCLPRYIDSIDSRENTRNADCGRRRTYRFSLWSCIPEGWCFSAGGLSSSSSFSSSLKERASVAEAPYTRWYLPSHMTPGLQVSCETVSNITLSIHRCWYVASGACVVWKFSILNP